MKTIRVILFAFFSGLVFIILPFSTIHLSNFSLFCDMLLFVFLFTGTLSGGYYRKKSLLLLRKFRDADSKIFIEELTKSLKHDYRIITLSVDDITAKHNIKISVLEGCINHIFVPLGIMIGLLIKIIIPLNFENNISYIKSIVSFEFPFILYWVLAFLPTFFLIKGNFEKKKYINNEKDLQKLLIKIQKYNSPFLSNNATQPTLLTIVSLDDFWKKLVKQLINTVNFIIIDTSVQSDNINWEIQQLSRNDNVIYLVKNQPTDFFFNDEEQSKTIEICANKKALVDHIKFIIDTK